MTVITNIMLKGLQ